MGDGMRTFAVLLWVLCAMNSNSYAQSENTIIEEESNPSAPTMVYGAAKKADGTIDSVLLEQPENAENPLGNPITSDQPPEIIPPAQNHAASVSTSSPAPSSINNLGSGPQGIPVGQGVLPNSPQAAQALGKDFQNTLVEGNGMIYDIQAYPEQDINVMSNPANPQTIYSPNVNP